MSDSPDPATEETSEELQQRVLAKELEDPKTAAAIQQFESVIAMKTRQLRVERGWSQATLAEKMTALGFDMHQTTIAKLEAAKRPIRGNEVYGLAAVFGLPIQALWYLPVEGEPWSLASMRKRLEAIDDYIAQIDQTIKTMIGVYADAQAERVGVVKAMNAAAQAASREVSTQDAERREASER